MLVRPLTETRSVLSRLLRLMSFVCCALVVASFAMFARDQAAGASQHQQTELVAGQSPTPGVEASAKPHRQPRRFIDGAAHTLTAPFAAIVPSSSAWVKQGLPAAFALLVYGIGLGYVARYLTVH
jgi:hypothetical protein